MKILLISLVFFCSFSFADEQKSECMAAVDAADTMNVNQKECDYSKEGLNGFLHKAFKKGEDGATLETENNKEIAVEKSQQSEKSVDKKEISTKKIIFANEFTNVQELQILKFQLLEKAAAECPKGFLVDGERYITSANKAMKLELVYRCL